MIKILAMMIFLITILCSSSGDAQVIDCNDTSYNVYNRYGIYQGRIQYNEYNKTYSLYNNQNQFKTKYQPSYYDRGYNIYNQYNMYQGRWSPHKNYTGMGKGKK